MVVGRKKERVFSVTKLVSSFSKRSPNGKREKWKMLFIIIVEGKKGTKLFDSRKAHLPELRPDLVTALSGLYVDDFTVIIKRERERETSEKFFLETTRGEEKQRKKKRAFCPSCVMCRRGDHDANEKSAKDNDIQARLKLYRIFSATSTTKKRDAPHGVCFGVLCKAICA